MMRKTDLRRGKKVPPSASFEAADAFAGSGMDEVAEQILFEDRPLLARRPENLMQKDKENPCQQGNGQ
ncbi:MAG: hypothetical protein KatS3mg130_0596 [Candidatus Sumerlaea sp.]|jgi:hypothetical protein|uniref:Uncharacterized protein n=1 Tax=Sumerlaea chitinivorans TaxID=2250252 RepID=A0A2Z4Y4N9_SUMC1|nr:hypothetical protein BRCON_1071 [Candidatus Sumerlaea chitinivorans]MCX7963965.1 hypothetical protein [Candidatus Sumerlaea chitinivorans]GIX44188.1 MAG: hypothetical protein KatS3mg130_0596 [Candidatus Sumerlaea sp.]